MLRQLAYLLCLGAGLLIGVPEALAQAAPHSMRAAPRAPVLLTIVDTLPQGEPRFRIVRMAGQSSPDVILLPPDATVELLADAIGTVRTVWARGHKASGATEVLRRAPIEAERPPRPLLPWGDRVLRDLREAPERHVPGVGRVKAVRIWLVPLTSQDTGR